MMLIILTALPVLICTGIYIWARQQAANPPLQAPVGGPAGPAPLPAQLGLFASWFAKLNQKVQLVEASLSFRVAGVLIAISVVFSGAALVGYLASGDKKAAIEYGSYIMPCFGTIAAGAAIYVKSYEKVAFATSLIFFLLGVQLFLAGHANHIFMWGMSVIGVLILLSMTLLAVFLSTPATSKFGIDLRDGIVVVVVGAVSIWSGAFLLNNVDCLQDVMKSNTCKEVWYSPQF